MANQDSGNSVYHIVAFTFPGKDRAAEVMKSAKYEAKEAGMKIVASAVVEVNDKGKTNIHQPGRGGVGTTAGLVAGGLLGLVGGPAGLLVWAAGGALIGGVAGKYLGRNLPEQALRELGQKMDPNTSAILIIAQDKNAESVINEMKEFDAQVVTVTVGDQLSGEIDQYIAANVTATEAATTSEPAAIVDSSAAPAASVDTAADAKSA